MSKTTEELEALRQERRTAIICADSVLQDLEKDAKKFYDNMKTIPPRSGQTWDLHNLLEDAMSLRVQCLKMQSKFDSRFSDYLKIERK